jgi:hypothetical protein
LYNYLEDFKNCSASKAALHHDHAATTACLNGVFLSFTSPAAKTHLTLVIADQISVLILQPSSSSNCHHKKSVLGLCQIA